jgi:hypothetical protein
MSRPSTRRVSWPWLALAVAVVLIAAAIVVGGVIRSRNTSTSGAGSEAPGPSRTSASVSPTPSIPGSSTTPVTDGASPTAPPDPILAQGYVPLYPFAGLAEVQEWERSYQQGGHQPWHLSPTMTAQSFVGFLRFTEIDRITSRSVRGDGAHVGVGYRNPAGRLTTAAVLHLMRYGTDALAPWEVVGSDDTTFTFDSPDYGSRVTSPLQVGGRITGVDENINVAVYQQITQVPLGRTQHGTPAGGQGQPWSVTVSYSGARPTVALIVVAWTGGHVRTVERFAINGFYA